MQGVRKEDAYQNKSVAMREATHEKSKKEHRRLQRHLSADPMRLGSAKGTITLLWKFPTTYLNWCPPSVKPGPLMLGFPPCKFERSQMEYRDPYVAPILG